VRDGNAPAMASWLREGGHRLHVWETDWSSQTGACQAGILHGSNEDMPAFRWWEKDRGAAIVTNHPKDAAELERRVSDGRGLLHADGASRANILSGDAPHSLLTMSTVMDRSRPGRIGADYFTYFSRPFNASRSLVRAVGDIARELRAAAVQRHLDVRPRVHRGFTYAVMRAWATVVQLDLQVESVIGDIHAGRPVVYTTFLAYDEVAHHSGIERPDTLATLRQVDRAVARIAAVAAAARRPYELVVLSDHGQTQGATFLQRYGETLEALVARACETHVDAVAASDSGEDEARGRLGAALTEAAGAPGAGGRAVRAATRRRTVDGEVRLDERGDEARDELPEIAVMASGCLGLISFPRLPGRVTREEIDERWPALLQALREHPGIGFVLVRSREHGPVALGAHGEHRLDGGELLGVDPLAPYGPRTARHVARTDGFEHCPDILVNSTWWPETEEVAAFEELVGSHGGLGGPQAHPFVLAPAAWPWPAGDVVGAEEIHRILRGWLARLGHEAYAEVVRA
jgi:Type I phosphodiesterase / nucleotide pyrophosphatase